MSKPSVWPGHGCVLATWTGATSPEPKSTLESFAAMGLTERYEESVDRIRQALGWRQTQYEPRNRSESPLPREDIPGWVIRRLEESNALDRELYEHGRASFG